MNNNFGLTQDTIHKIQTVLASYPEIKKAILYGSRAKGNYKNGSDIDLTLILSNQYTMQTKKPPHSLIEIGVALDELDLPYTFDLSVYENIKNSELIEHINRVGLSFYEKQND